MADKKAFDDLDFLKNFFNNVFNDLESPYRIILERGWYRNILYYLGEQWLVWLEGAGNFGAKYRLNYSVPTPVSNIVRDYIRSMKALILNKQYTASIWPNSQEIADKDAADVGNAVLKWLDQRNDQEIEDVKEQVVLWLGLSGNAFIRTFAELDGNGFVLDAAGNPVSRADVCSDVVLPFNVRAANLGTRLRHKKWVGVKTLVYREWAEDTYKVKLTATADMRQVDYQRQLLQLVANVSPWKGRSLESLTFTDNVEDMAILKEIEWRPDAKSTNGKYVAMIDDTVLKNKNRLPIPVEDGKWFYTLDHFKYNETPGGFWASGGVDDLISPQNIINEIDQALATNRKSLGRPFVLTPSDLVLQRMSERGQALLAIKYDSQSALGQKLQIHPGTPYPQQVMDERTTQRQVGQEASGDPKNVLRGQAPYAGAPGIAIDILRETAEQGHAPDIRRFYRVLQGVARKRLILAAKLFTDTRLIKIKGKGNQVKIFHFTGADLHGNLDVHLELDSGLSFTNVGKNQFLMQLVQYRFWDPTTGPKPDVRRELMRRFGMSGFPEDENLHRDRAEYENSIIVKGGEGMQAIAIMPIPTGERDPEDPTGRTELAIEQDDPVFEMVDDHYSHVSIHDQLILSREFKDLSEEQQMIALFHREAHAQKLAEQIMSEQTLQQAQGKAQGVRDQMVEEEAYAEGEMEGPVGQEGM